jgi:hypothetical protein
VTQPNNNNNLPNSIQGNAEGLIWCLMQRKPNSDALRSVSKKSGLWYFCYISIPGDWRLIEFRKEMDF